MGLTERLTLLLAPGVPEDDERLETIFLEKMGMGIGGRRDIISDIRESIETAQICQSKPLENI